METLSALYKEIRERIIARTKEFRTAGQSGNLHLIFEELCFCLLTPQSKAHMAYRAIEAMKADGALYHAPKEVVAEYLNIVRFKNHKAAYIVEAREKIIAGNYPLLEIIRQPPTIARDQLVRDIKGYGYKEGSHFLRNIGRGETLAILDRHILRNLLNYGIIETLPDTLTRERYLAIEEKLIMFAEKIAIPPDHLDFVLWYKEAGDVFK